MTPARSGPKRIGPASSVRGPASGRHYDVRARRGAQKDARRRGEPPARGAVVRCVLAEQLVEELQEPMGLAQDRRVDRCRDMVLGRAGGLLCHLRVSDTGERAEPGILAWHQP
jgi:hypothetical protein